MGKLNDRAIRAARADGKDEFIGDGGGLYLRVRASGAKYWLFRYKSGPRTQWFELGTYPALSLADARVQAVALTAKRRQGIDPKEEQRQEAAQRAAEALEALAEAARVAARLNVAALFERWERQELTGRKDKGAETRRAFEKDILPRLGGVPAADVSRAMVAEVLDSVRERGAPIVARNLLGDLRQMYGFAIERGLAENDPTSHLKRDRFGRKVERDRVLSEPEIKELAKKLPDARVWASSEAAVWIMLSTCCRVGEISQARIADVDLQAGTWFIPAGNSKNAKAHTVYLSDFAAGHFQSLIERAQSLGSQWLLPGKIASKDGTDAHVCVKSLAKQIGDRQRGKEGEPMKGRTPLVNALALSGGKWTPHDLRRTGATMMGRLGVRPDVIEKCLNHTEQNALVRIYQRQELIEEQREAWRLLGERLALLTCTGVGNVVTLTRMAI